MDEEYNRQIIRLSAAALQQSDKWIFHLHTLNLIDLAQDFKATMPQSRVITHLHCIPWKNTFNTNRELFNGLYARYVSTSGIIAYHKDAYLRSRSEMASYLEADHVICVTQCGKKFLERISGRTKGVSVIPNGDDAASRCAQEQESSAERAFHCLYVGILSESKGITYVVEAIDRLNRQGYAVHLTACGQVAPAMQSYLERKYPYAKISFKGLLSYEALEPLYISADCGVIASLQEQSSLAAIEMMKYGLPIVTTSVDGLDEMSTDGIDALKVPVRFSSCRGLSVDVGVYVQKLACLIENPELRERLSRQVMQTFEHRFSLSRMTNATLEIYRMLD